MPNASDFLIAFDLIQGKLFGHYILHSASSTHEPVKRYQEYLYGITLVFNKVSASPSYEEFSSALINKINQEHIVYGVKNPYRCIIDTPKDGDIIEDENGNITIKLIGHSYRVH